MASILPCFFHNKRLPESLVSQKFRYAAFYCVEASFSGGLLPTAEPYLSLYQNRRRPKLLKSFQPPVLRQ